eukprot:6184685-Pleurochrysis_carterae.AAC.2
MARLVICPILDLGRGSPFVELLREGPLAFSGPCLQVYAPVRKGEQLVLKSSAISSERIGSFSAGAAASAGGTPNYPTGFSTVVRERLVGGTLSAGEGEGKAHVVPLFASWVDGGRLWLAMGLVNGCDLHELLEPARADPILSDFVGQPCAVMLRLMRQMALAVEYLAKHRVVWRDGGLQNWMIQGACAERTRASA